MIAKEKFTAILSFFVSLHCFFMFYRMIVTNYVRLYK